MRDRLLQRNNKICEEYYEMFSNQHLRVGYCLQALSKKYCLEEKTIWYIVKGYGVYKKTNN